MLGHPSPREGEDHEADQLLVMSLDEGMQAFGYRVPKLILSCNLVQGFAPSRMCCRGCQFPNLLRINLFISARDRWRAQGHCIYAPHLSFKGRQFERARK
jgi:hypothetical protein